VDTLDFINDIKTHVLVCITKLFSCKMINGQDGMIDG